LFYSPVDLSPGGPRRKSNLLFHYQPWLPLIPLDLIGDLSQSVLGSRTRWTAVVNSNAWFASYNLSPLDYLDQA
jgi:hypothetical protein